MAVKYLKKKRLYEIAKALGLYPQALKYCTYKFYRGAEWLSFYTEDYSSYYKIYSCYGGKMLSVREYDLETNKELSSMIINGGVDEILNIA